MSVAAPVRVTLVGAGSMGSLHARVIAQSDRAELAFVVDSRREVGERVATQYGAGWAPDLERALGVDAVVVAAATESHHRLGLDVLAHGLPLLLEKPLADEFADAQDIVECSAKNDVPLMCGLLERYNPAIMTALSLIREPRHVNAVRHSPHVARIRTGVAGDLLIHDVDTVVRLAGADPVVVRGALGFSHPDSPPGSEDTADALLTFPGGMTATLSASRLSQRKVRAYTIAEVGRLVEVDMLLNSVTIYRHVLNDAAADGLSYTQQTILEIPKLVSAREPLAAQLDRFLDLVSGVADVNDVAAERASILPAHRVVDLIRQDAAR